MNALTELCMELGANKFVTMQKLYAPDGRHLVSGEEAVKILKEEHILWLLSQIKWARIEYNSFLDEEKHVYLQSKDSKSVKKLREFYKALAEIDYDNGYGTQELFGVIVLNNNGWLERYEYDGSECWVHKVPPTEPDWENLDMLTI